MNPRKNNPYAAAIICAAGASARMGGIKKEYRLLPGAETDSGATNGSMTVLCMAVLAFAALPAIKVIVITVPADPALGGEAAARNALPPQLLERASPAIHFVTGGATRRASVFNALSFLAEQKLPVNMALIHDGARPWVSSELIERVIDETAIHRAVIPLLPLTETPKEIDLPLGGDNGAVLIKRHLKRAVIGAAQTPQGFAFPAILEAHQQAAVAASAVAAAAQDDSRHEIFTDDAEVWAAFCGPVTAISGESENRKITFLDDLI